MSYTKMVNLVTKLANKTAIGRIQWEPTNAKDTFQIAFPDYTVMISQVFNDDTQEIDYFISIYNFTGSLIESVSDVELKDDFENAYKTMEELYESARRIAMGVDSALDSLLQSLDADDPG